MKKPKCSHCNKTISRTIGFRWEAASTYYLNSRKTSVNRFWGHTGDIYKTRKGPKEKSCWKYHKEVLGFYCNKCGNKFPDSETKSIKKYLLSDHIIQKLKGDYDHQR